MELSPNGEPVDKKPILTADGLIQTSTQSANTANSSPNTTLTASNLDIEILPVIYDIIRCVEKDPKDNTAKQRESQECSQKILELQKRFESARAQIRLLPGIDYNKEEQLQKLELLKNQLKLKQQLIRKYKDIQF
ncbi:mediator of RNA polymerase II transcription subunit 9-like [Lucilia sericata]|uniref:mediator of RNA polymerase II transcription subunit 9 n=1 Tax=Lucilia sericata TaxID=13632 RepID=UPI0018A82BE2|nr:mediator of RNA polymerase II transcription subunit 9 [Lucilia sericata]XP_037826742.1 mediator of RNA polymerase II transcription subunit 9-like [Lucilia sericata]